MEKDYYTMLGVLPSAEDFLIRAVYKALAMRYHPDKFAGDTDEATRRMAEINEAYEVLSSPQKRAEYDRLRGEERQQESSLRDEGTGEAKGFDPIEGDWAIATRYCPELIEISDRLSRFSKDLAYSFKVLMIESKKFSDRNAIALKMEGEFLAQYFGTNVRIQNFARHLLLSGSRAAAKELNDAARVFGDDINYDAVRWRICAEYKIDFEPLRDLFKQR